MSFSRLVGYWTAQRMRITGLIETILSFLAKFPKGRNLLALHSDFQVKFRELVRQSLPYGSPGVAWLKSLVSGALTPDNP